MRGAQAFWIGAVGGGKVDPADFSARLTGSFVAEASGPHRFGVFAAGLARARSSTAGWSRTPGSDWTPGRTFFEEGCDEVVGTVDARGGPRL